MKTITAESLKIFSERLIQLGFSDAEIIDEPNIAEYNKSTYPKMQINRLAIKPRPSPGDAAQRYSKICLLLELAKEYSIAVYPISCGKNWGYGGMDAMGTCSVVLDLSEFKLIDQYDTVSHQIRVEPGVTQKQLYDFLQQNGNLYLMDATGAPTTSSIIGNTLECGFGHTTTAERSKNVLNLSVAVPWGGDKKAQVYSTGLIGTYDQNNEFKRVINLGPEFAQLALQSNYFVTLNMTISLKLKPDAFCAYFIDLTECQFDQYIELSRKLRNIGVIHSASHIGNKHKAIQMALKHYPYEEVNNETPLPENYVDKICKHYGISDWTASGAFYGTTERVEADKTALKKAVRTINASIVFIDDTNLKFINKAERFFTQAFVGRGILSLVTKLPLRLSSSIRKLKQVDDLNALFYLKKGVPTNHFVTSTFWRTRLPVNDLMMDNPNNGITGFIWIAPSVPLCKVKVRNVVELITSIAEKFGFEPALSLTLLNERAAECVVSISYDRLNQHEESQAMACHDEILIETAKLGSYVYRLSSRSARSELGPLLHQAHERLDLKSHFDPNNIVAPSKYRNIWCQNNLQLKNEDK